MPNVPNMCTPPMREDDRRLTGVNETVGVGGASESHGRGSYAKLAAQTRMASGASAPMCV
jgi:hypothetical protein